MIRFIVLFFSLGFLCNAQNIENSEILLPFVNKLKSNSQVTNILFLGDSHIQAGHITGYLKDKFQGNYGNAGRGLVFPYDVANTNGSDDFSSSSNQTWETFRLVHEQDIFNEFGVAGFLIHNQKDSFLEIKFKKTEDSFDKVRIFHSPKMEGEAFEVYVSTESLENFVKRIKNKITYSISPEDSFPEIASKFYTTTTELVSLNGASVRKSTVGNQININKTEILYNNNFEKYTDEIIKKEYSKSISEVSYSTPQNRFLIKSNPKQGNTFYGFQFLKNTNKGVVFNTIGVNGATYSDFYQYDLLLNQVDILKSDIVIISL